ncbi:hypothetical protein CPB85DRAFT_1436591 [Mucidula mucida]|nr:hypothetical protein CPB85DRAFT_1436591 [Mucidula mucida]
MTNLKHLSLLVVLWFAIDMTRVQLAVANKPESGKRRCQDFERAMENCSDATLNCCTDEYISILTKCMDGPDYLDVQTHFRAILSPLRTTYFAPKRGRVADTDSEL